MVYDVNLNVITLCTYPMVHISKTFHHTREILPTHVCMYFIHVHVKYRHSFLSANMVDRFTCFVSFRWSCYTRQLNLLTTSLD